MSKKIMIAIFLCVVLIVGINLWIKSQMQESPRPVVQSAPVVMPEQASVPPASAPTPAMAPAAIEEAPAVVAPAQNSAPAEKKEIIYEKPADNVILVQ